MKRSLRIFALGLAILWVVGIGATAAVQRVTVPQGTVVNLVFDQALDSKTAKVGQTVKLHVVNNVMVGNQKIIAAGTPVTAVISNVEHRKRYGVNAKIGLTPNPVASTYGQAIPLEPRTEGKYVQGKKSRQAAGATAGGAVLLGPVGLAGGYFIHGKRVQIKPGDQLSTQVSRNVTLSRKA
jgi:hypothetical protein